MMGAFSLVLDNMGKTAEAEAIQQQQTLQVGATLTGPLEPKPLRHLSSFCARQSCRCCHRQGSRAAGRRVEGGREGACSRASATPSQEPAWSRRFCVQCYLCQGKDVVPTRAEVPIPSCRPCLQQHSHSGADGFAEAERSCCGQCQS